MEIRIVKFQIVKPNKQRFDLTKRYDINNPKDLHEYEQLKAGSIVMWKNQVRKVIFGKLKNFIDKKLIYEATAKSIDLRGCSISFPTEIELRKQKHLNQKSEEEIEMEKYKARKAEGTLSEDEPYLKRSDEFNENYTLTFSEYVAFLIEQTVGDAGLGAPSGLIPPVSNSVFSGPNVYAPGDNRTPKALGSKKKKKKKGKSNTKKDGMDSYLVWKRNLKSNM